jgi:hypothetical protein
MDWNGVSGEGLDYCNFRRTFHNCRSWKCADDRIIDSGFVTAVTEDATRIAGADVPMHQSRKAGNRKYGHHDYQAVSPPISAHRIH